jgi:Uma2 family endonuclease
MQTLEQLKRQYSPGEYLKLEDAAEFRSEYINGRIIPKLDGTVNHNRLVGNLCSALNNRISDHGFESFIFEVKVCLSEGRVYAYPDMMVVAGEPIYFEDRSDIITNPQVIIEVLSTSTRDYDRGDKFMFYRSLPSFQEYLLIDQKSMRVERHTKTGIRQWSMQEYTAEDTAITFATVPFEISLATLYNKVRFPTVELMNSDEVQPD